MNTFQQNAAFNTIYLVVLSYLLRRESNIVLYRYLEG